MALDPVHFEYPKRRYGMDHDRYEWSMLTDRKPITWPGGAKLALWVEVALQFVPCCDEVAPQAHLRLVEPLWLGGRGRTLRRHVEECSEEVVGANVAHALIRVFT